MTKQLRELDHTLEQTRRQQESLHLAHNEARGRFRDFGGRIASLEDQIPALVSQIAETSSGLKKMLSTLAIELLERRKQLLHDYLIQARFGLASLLDRNSRRDMQ